jgi:3-keto steroid reductase
MSRVTLEPALVDLCTLSTVFSAAEKLASRVPRLDVLICNAGIGGWDGLDFWGAWRQFLNEGIVAMVSRPNYKICRVGASTRLQLTGDVRDKDGEADEPVLGEVFCANVFGHYIFVHETLGLLSRGGSNEDHQQGRVIWIGTGEATASHFNLDDFQGLESLESYEHTKRLMDILILGAQNGAQSEANQYLAQDVPSREEDKDIEHSMYIVSKEDFSQSSSGSSAPSSQSNDLTPPKMYITHPGVCLTAIAPLNLFMTWLQIATIYIARWCGSKWHTNTPYKGATSAVWLALASNEALEEENAAVKKWGSMVSRWGKESVTETPVDGWGIAGEEEKGEYGVLARKVWREMEHLRKDWTDRVKID